MDPSTAKWYPWAGILWLVLALPAAVQAQATGATLAGTVTGPGEAPVPNAKVSVRNVATGQSVDVQSNPSGSYRVPNLAPGDYQVSVSAEGFSSRVSKVTVTAGQNQTANVTLLLASGNAAAPSLGDLGFSPGEAQGSVVDQARLDRRSHMLKIHQRLGLITLAPLVATLISSSGAKARHGSVTGRDWHAALGATTAGLYFTTASFAIFAPKVPGTKTRGPIRVHKALAWIHGPGMVLTPILGAMAFNEINSGEKVHGIAKLHSTTAWVTGVAYGAAILSVSIRF